ncbi:hypothetical protein BU24DRAFT_366636 [Aaosphaeria arxii CBS 175.79]|uniref:Uncharacterized protein n=1 Tax=Aaosphaeria arxii CBS 175.79 TaxID=1450172 RepID=A0A6A5XV45_9PLEO|nr:uncharacterized protein BU24DRAFT_366636 [Aaosphaeria arxii CBS 175.79]KAF2017092.1 hypothetical protein BU24DRAFT_366636 [Aaosphaeria arxii CBS 175.79]
MPTIPLHLPDRTTSSQDNPLPPLLHTPSGLAILELQGTIHFPTPVPDAQPSTLVGNIVFPHYKPDADPKDTKWMKRVYFYIGKNQRMAGECKKLAKPFAVVRKRGTSGGAGGGEGEDVDMEGGEGGREELEIAEIVRYKIGGLPVRLLGRRRRDVGCDHWTSRNPGPVAVLRISTQHAIEQYGAAIISSSLAELAAECIEAMRLCRQQRLLQTGHPGARPLPNVALYSKLLDPTIDDQSCDYYHQCQPGASSPEPIPEEPAPEPPAATEVLPGTPIATGVPAGSGPGKQLQTGYYWIRGVAAPNFHKYMQSKPLYATGPAVLGDYTTAGQFQVVGDQLVQLVSGPGEKPEKLLYGVVGEERVINNNSLGVTWSEAKNAYGKFAWNGDGLVWSVAGVQRPNAAAWYVCEGQKMYINLGNYLYQTPKGCADQTIHYYNDKTANN